FTDHRPRFPNSARVTDHSDLMSSLPTIRPSFNSPSIFLFPRGRHCSALKLYPPSRAGTVFPSTQCFLGLQPAWSFHLVFAMHFVSLCRWTCGELASWLALAGAGIAGSSICPATPDESQAECARLLHAGRRCRVR